MQAAEQQTVKSDPDVEVNAASASTAIEADVDLTPPKKRIKSEQASRRASIEPVQNPFAAASEDGTVNETPSVLSAPEAVKMEQDGVARAPAARLADQMPTTSVAPSRAFKSEPSPSSSATPSATATSAMPNDADTPSGPAAKKKKTSSTTKKESTASSSSSKTKKSASSTKKASSSASTSTHAETSSSRGKPKVEILSPPPTTSAANAPDADEEEEDNALYCICQRRQDDVEGGMIMCDRCDQWYHYRCMGMTEDDAELVDQFICPPCHDVTGEQTTYKEACARSGCRRAAVTPFSRFCSDRCGVLAVTANMAALKVEKNKAAIAAYEANRRVMAGRKTEGLTERTDHYAGEWSRIHEGANDDAVLEQRLGLADAFAMMVNGDREEASPAANDVPNGVVADTGINGTPAEPSPSPLPRTQETQTSPSQPTTAESSSATSLINIHEQIDLVTRQMFAVDLEKARLNARLDRLDHRSKLLHLASDRVPTLPPVGSSSTTAAGAADANGDGDGDEDMPEESVKKPSKKKKAGSKSKSKAAAEGSGPRCGYDQRLHWNDAIFDAWAHAEPGSSILSEHAALDGILDDAEDADSPQAKVVCATGKRKCKRHMDWSNLCELSLDAEKASLNADSLTLSQLKLGLAETLTRLREELEAVKELVEVQERRERRRREDRDREIAFQVANQGTRRGAAA